MGFYGYQWFVKEFGCHGLGLPGFPQAIGQANACRALHYRHAMRAIGFAGERGRLGGVIRSRTQKKPDALHRAGYEVLA
jgi:hypothetical protein